jgi:PAS domain S-box-containing protein
MGSATARGEGSGNSFLRREWRGLALGGGTLTGLLAVDLASGAHTSLVGTFTVAPFLTALGGRWRSTLAVGLAALVAALVVPLVNDGTNPAESLLRAGVIAAATAFATIAARNRELTTVATARLRVLDAIGEIATGALPLAETLRLATERITPAVADVCMIDVLRGNSVTRAAVGVAGHPRGPEIELGLRRRTPSTPDHFVRAVAEGTLPEPWLRSPVTEEDLRRLAHDPPDLEFLRSLSMESALIVPLVARGKAIGALTMITAWSERVYEQDDVHFAQILSGRVALALDNAGLFSDLESVERRMQNVMEILDEAVVIHDGGGALIYANPAAARTMGFGSVQELLETPVAEIRDRFVTRREDGTPAGPEDFVGLRVLRGERPDPLILRSTDRITGVERWNLTKANPIEGADGKVLYSVTAIEDVTEVKRAEFAQRLLARTGELLAASTDYRRTLRDVAALAVPEFADWCAVSLPGDDGYIEQVGVAHRDPDRVALANELSEKYPQPLAQPGGVGEVMRTGNSLVVEVIDEMLEEAARDEEHLRLLRELDMHSALAVPMTVGARAVGALTFVNESGSRRFSEFDAEVAREIGRRAGIAVENARLTSQRAEVAEVLQRGLLPPAVPNMAGWDLATMYTPAGEVNEVGGDFYDAFEVEGGWMLVIGDVVGRGPQAASLTALARYTIRTAGMLTGDPLVCLSLLNDALLARTGIAPCTVAIAILPDSDSPDADVSVVCAGHPLPLLLSNDSVTEVGRPGVLLGAFEEPSWEVDTVRVSEGDELVLYTDGVVEARGEDGRFGDARLHAAVAGATRPIQVVAGVEAALTSFIPGEPDDDAALVAVSRTGPGHRSGGAKNRAIGRLAV